MVRGGGVGGLGGLGNRGGGGEGRHSSTCNQSLRPCHHQSGSFIMLEKPLIFILPEQLFESGGQDRPSLFFSLHYVETAPRAPLKLT